MMRSCARTKRPSTRAGLTIIELLAAAALASMLMVAVLGLLRILVVKQRILVDQTRMPPWQHLLVHQLRLDLSNARRFELAPDRLLLVGYGGKDFDTRRPTHRPAEVLYRLVSVGDRTWLLRQETHVDSLSNANRRTEIACSGLSVITMDVPGESERKPQRSGVVPECFQLAVVGDSPPEPVVEIFYCR